MASIAGLALLVWNADRFVESSASTARYFGMPPLLIGMVIVGFGTSAPEMVVSALAAIEGRPGITLGNTYGSNIANITLILGVTALISPIPHPWYIRQYCELPILKLLTVLSVALITDFDLSRLDAVVLLLVFGALMAWTIYQGLKQKDDSLANEIEAKAAEKSMPLKRAVFWLAGTGLIRHCRMVGGSDNGSRGGIFVFQLKDFGRAITPSIIAARTFIKLSELVEFFLARHIADVILSNSFERPSCAFMASSV